MSKVMGGGVRGVSHVQGDVRGTSVMFKVMRGGRRPSVMSKVMELGY